MEFSARFKYRAFRRETHPHTRLPPLVRLHVRPPRRNSRGDCTPHRRYHRNSDAGVHLYMGRRRLGNRPAHKPTGIRNDGTKLAQTIKNPLLSARGCGLLGGVMRGTSFWSRSRCSSGSLQGDRNRTVHMAH